MAQLTYTAQDGDLVSIPLPAEPGFTATILWFAPPSKEDERTLGDQLGRIGVPQQSQAGDHIVYSMPGLQLAVIIQPRAAQSEVRLVEARMLMHRTPREWMVVADGLPRLCIDQQPIHLMKIVKEGMHIQLGGLDLIFQEVDRRKADRGLLRSIGRRACPYCGDAFQAGDWVITCPSCGTLQHAECWDEYGGRCSGPPGCRYGVKSKFASEPEGSTS
jgi:hypothetical protein